MARLKEGPQTIPQMVAKNYADTPLHLHAAAGRSMLAHLIQMVKDGRVKTEDGQAPDRIRPIRLSGECPHGSQTFRQDRADHRRQPRHRLCLRRGLRRPKAARCTSPRARRNRSRPARDKIRARHNVPVEIHAADFSKGDTVRSVVEAVGHADILVNNAGAIPRGDILAMTEPKWREAWELKVFGYINATRAMLEKMYARKKGAVVNIIGLAGESYNYDYVAGTMGNAGLMAFTRAVGSKSVDHGVRVVAINPPATRTDRMTPCCAARPSRSWATPSAGPSSPSTCRSAAPPSPTRSPTSRCSWRRIAPATSAAW